MFKLGQKMINLFSGGILTRSAVLLGRRHLLAIPYWLLLTCIELASYCLGSRDRYVDSDRIAAVPDVTKEISISVAQKFGGVSRELLFGLSIAAT